MKIYDSHSDIFSNLYERKLAGIKDPFKKYHLDALKKGEVVGGIWVVYSEHDFDILKAYQDALEIYAPYKNNYDVIFGLEGLRNVHNLEMFDALYELGVRHAMLTWNEENHLATGVAGEASHGLKPEGKKFLKYMYEHQMIIDVSHLNIQSFYDVLDYMPYNIIASHSNAFTLSDHRRNLNDEQLKLMREVGGYVGVVSARNFVSKDPKKQNVNGLIDQIIYLADKVGIDHVMLGLDIMDYLNDYDGQNANLDDLKGHGDSQNLINEMIKRSFSQSDIEKIAYKNYLDLARRIKRP